MNARKTFLGLAGVALIAASGIFAAACGSSPSNPAPSGSSGGTGASSGGGSGTTSGATTGTGSGTTASGTASGAAGATGASSGTTTANDGGVDATLPTTDGGDGAAPEAAACNPTGAIYPAGDACAPCAANLLNACSTFNVTCISFDNSVVPDAHF